MENFNDLKWSYNSSSKKPKDNLKYYLSFVDDGVIKKRDTLFCQLNEIEPDLLTDIKLKVQPYLEDIAIDPRNSMKIENFENDFSIYGRYLKKTKIFNAFPKNSSLTKPEHAACLKYLHAIQSNKVPLSSDIEIYKNTTEKREKEYKIFTEFVENYYAANPNILGKRLETLYRNYIKTEAQKCLNEPNKFYSIQTALPLFEKMNLGTESASLEKSELIFMEGQFPKYLNKIDIIQITCDYEKYFVNNFDNNFDFKSQINNTKHDVLIDEEALEILLGASSDFVENWEIPFEINGDNFETKSIDVKAPSPIRCINSKTNLFTFKILFNNFMSSSNQFQWMEWTNGNFTKINKNCEEEIDAVKLQKEFNLITHDFFLSKYVPSTNKKVFSNKIISKNYIEKINLKEEMIMLIAFKNIGFVNDENIPSFIYLSHKLEYKSHFGSEMMTKSELLKEWIRLNFIPNTSLRRDRMDVETFESLYTQQLDREKLANALDKLYNIKTSNLLAKIYDFFNLLKKFPSAKYLLQFNPAHSDKIIVFKESHTMCSNGLSLHSLYEDIGKHSNFIIKNKVLPIDESLCTSLHHRHKILPKHFPLCGSKRQLLTNDRASIAKRAKEKTIKKIENQEQKIKLIKKNKKSKTRRKRLRASLKKKTKVISDTEEVDYNYTDLLINQYTLKKSSEYNAVKDLDSNSILSSDDDQNKKLEDFDIEKYLADANSSSTNCTISRDEYIESKQNKSSPSPTKYRKKNI